MRTHVLRTDLCLSLAIAMLLCFQGAGAEAKAVTVDAAYTSPSFLYLISDQELMYVSRASKQEMIRHQIYEPEQLIKLDVHAAYSDPDISQAIVFYYGPKYGLKVKNTGNKKVKRIKYGTNGAKTIPGPDAAARKGDDIYLFRKNKVAFAVNFTTWEDAEDVKKYKGMPKNIDAAWNDGDGMYLLKGNKIWRWNKDGTVSNSIFFHDEYNLKSWSLKP